MAPHRIDLRFGVRHETEGAIMRPKIVSAYDATPAAADGLALGAPLADLRGADILVARVLPHTRSGEATERALQASFHATIQETRETAAEFLGDRPFEVWPVFGESVAAGLDDLPATAARS
jgi:hypothetical protein